MNLEVRLEGLVTTAELASRPDFPLGEAVVSPSARTVTGPAGRIDVEPRVMQLLVVLADAQGAVVTRATLFRRCWGSPAVSDDSLNRAVRSLRKIADEVAQGSFELETIPRTGYRLTTAASSAQAAPLQSFSRRKILYVGLAAAAAGLGVPGYRWLAKDRGDPRVAALIERSELTLRNGSLHGEAAAVRLLEQAARIDPSNALVWGRLALARYRQAEHAPPGQTADLTASTQEAASRALALDSRQVDARASLALLPPYYGDWLAAGRRMDSVLAIDPLHLATLDARSFMRSGVGFARSASLERLEIAAPHPLDVGQQFKLIYAHWILGNVPAADRAADRALQLWPKHPAAWFGRLWTLAFTGRPERALAHVNDAAARPPLPPANVEMLRTAMTAIAGRRPADVERAVELTLGLLALGPSNSVNAIMILASLGKLDAAFDVASAYLLERGPLLANIRWRPDQLSVDTQRRRKLNMLFVPVTAGMRADPRFMTLATQIGLAKYWDQVGIAPDFMAAAAPARLSSKV